MNLATAHAMLAHMQKHHVLEAAKLCNSTDVLHPLSNWPLRTAALALMGNGGDLDDLESLADLVAAIERAKKMGLERQANFQDWWEATERVRDAVYEEAEQCLRQQRELESGQDWE